MSFYINSGTEPVADADLEDAWTNMKSLIADANVPDAEIRYTGRHERGRFTFQVSLGEREAEVDMPGLPLEQVRFLGPPQNIWDFPRMYVDGSSWVWKFGMSILGRSLRGEFEDDE